MKFWPEQSYTKNCGRQVTASAHHPVHDPCGTDIHLTMAEEVEEELYKWAQLYTKLSTAESFSTHSPVQLVLFIVAVVTVTTLTVTSGRLQEFCVRSFPSVFVQQYVECLFKDSSFWKFNLLTET